jgi:acylphosphatase
MTGAARRGHAMAEGGEGEELAHLIVRVRGVVQGVGFRYFVQRRARELALAGYVRNLPDGKTVLLEAEGPRRGLELLLEAVRHGPRGARVEEGEVAWEPWKGLPNGFEVRL